MLNVPSGESLEKREAPARALDVARDLNRAVMTMQADCYAEDGSGVDYKRLTMSKESGGAAELFEAYEVAAMALAHVRDEDVVWDDARAGELMALWLNVYNALTVHAICACQKQCTRDGAPLIASVLEVPDFWGKSCYQVGSYVLSLDDIEHGVLRGNRPHPSTKKRCFADGDARLRLAIPDEKVDPRLHFALVCGARSCPPIRVFDEKNVEKALTKAANAFLLRELRVTGPTSVEASSILKWYGSDFAGGKPNDKLRVLADMLTGTPASDALRSELLGVLTEAERLCVDVTWKYTDYDWRLNAT